MISRNVMLAACAASLLVALAGCSDSRTPPVALPKHLPVVNAYSSPTSALETLSKGMADKNRSNGQDAYMGALADSIAGDGRAFHAFFDPTDLVEHPWPHDWTREFEPQLLYDLFRKYS